MPSTAETYILLSILGVILASLPLAMLWWRRKGPPAVEEAPALPSPDLPYQPPGRVVPSPLPYTPYQPPGNAVPPPLPSSPDPYQPPATAIHAPAPSFDPHRKPVFGRADAWFALVLVFVVAVLMGPVSSLLVMGNGEAAETVKIEYTSTLFLFQIVFQLFIVVLILVWLRAWRKFSIVQLFGFKKRGPFLTVGLALLCLIGTYIVLILFSMAVMPLIKQMTGMDLKQQGLVESAPDIQDPLTRVLMVITLCVGAPLMEEIVFRGIIFGVASRYFRPVYATVASSMFFGVIHNNLLSFLPLTVLAICLAEAYRWTRTLAVPLLMHSAFNGITFLILTYGPPELRNM